MIANLPARLVAEFVGAFALVFIGAATTAAADGELLAGAFGYGLAYAGMLAAVGGVAGGHFNPAVTFGVLLSGGMRVLDALWCWGMQLAGAVLGAACFAWFDMGHAADAVPALADGVDSASAVGIEAVLTFLLVWVICGVAATGRRTPQVTAAVPIGLVVVVGVLAAGPLTGGVMNPARAFGPAVSFTEFGDWWVYWVGPMLGGAVGALAYSMVFGADGTPSDIAVTEQ